MTKENTFDRFIELPYDILSSILDKLPVYDLYECILTCHSWYDTILMLSRTVSGEQCQHDEVSCNPNYDPWYLEELGLYRLFSRPPPVIVIEPCSQQNRVFHHLTLLSDAVPDLRVLEFNRTNIFDAPKLAQLLKQFSRLESISFTRQCRNFPLIPIITACLTLTSLHYSLDDRIKVRCWNPHFQSLVPESTLHQSSITQLCLRSRPRTCCPPYFQLNPILLSCPKLEYLNVSSDWAYHMNDVFFNNLLTKFPKLQSLICFQATAPSKIIQFKQKHAHQVDGLIEFGFYRRWGILTDSVARIMTQHQHSLQHLVLDSREPVWVVKDDDDDIIKQRIRKTDAWIQDIKTPQLMHLECIDVDVSGPVLRQWLMKSTALKSVTLGGEQLTEDALDALGYLPQLRHLHLIVSYAIPPSDTTFLPYISLLDNLQSLSLHCSSFVTDKTLPAIGSLPNLKALEIKHWNVSESGIIQFVVALKQASIVSQLKLQALGSLNERTLSMLGNVISLVDLTIIKCIVSAAGMRTFIDKKKQVIKSLGVYSSKQRSEGGVGCIRHGTVHLGDRFEWVY